ncbi:MAG: peptidoglycan-binding protein [Acidobacteriota bacterium]|nr:peptidoglycan-binding protein [Acidobacteriota bacterium]
MMRRTTGRWRRGFVMAVPAVAWLLATPPVALGQNQPGARPAEQASPPSLTVTIHLSPAAVQQVQRALKAAGFAPDRVDGLWSEGTARAVRGFQDRKGLDASGHPNLMTLVALGLPQLLEGGAPTPGAGDPPSKDAIAAGGTPLYFSPAAVREIQLALQQRAVQAKSTAIPGNILGVWHAGSEKSAAEFQKRQGLAETGAADLETIHALGLDALVARPAPGNVEMLTPEQAPFGGLEIQAGPALVQVIQQALARQGMAPGAPTGRWTNETADAVRKLQEARGLVATGHLDLETLHALGFTHPLADLAQARPQS